jgi:hypothetical protein
MVTVFLAFCAWAILVLSVCSIWRTLQTGTNHIKKLHQIPCSGCEYFTNDYRLKCTVHPYTACSEEAIACLDFEPKTSSCNASQKRERKSY